MSETQPSMRTGASWLGPLRQRLLEVARRRVPGEVVEDVVQEALTVIHEKGSGSDAEAGVPPPMPWCFRVLRNIIGNHYQKQRTRARAANPGGAEHARVVEMFARPLQPTPLEALEQFELARLLDHSIDELADRDKECGRLLRSALGRAEPNPSPVAAPAVRSAASTEYVRAFRCRQRLKEILLRRGYAA